MSNEYCIVCGQFVGVLNRHFVSDDQVIHGSCKSAYESGQFTETPPSLLPVSEESLAKEVILTTAHHVIGRKMLGEAGIITAECVFGSNIFRDIFANVRDIVGGRASGQQKILRDAKDTCMRELKLEAIACGGDAVIGIDLDYQELSGGGKSMLFLVASGTAVKLEQIPE